MSKVLKIFTDGGSRGNPGPAGIGVFAQIDGKKAFELSQFIGSQTNNVAEYQAFISSVEILLPYLQHHQIEKIDWFLDSKLVVEQLSKNWKIKQEHLAKLAKEAWKLLDLVALPYSINYVPREKNKEADARVNQAQDEAINNS